MLKIASSAVKRDGEVWTGRRHSDAIRQAVFHGAVPPITSAEQGFVTSEGTFVSRKEAFKIAVASDQVCRPLYSEDLW